MCIRVLRQDLFGEGKIVPNVRAWYPVMLTGLPVCSVGIHDAKKTSEGKKIGLIKVESKCESKD